MNQPTSTKNFDWTAELHKTVVSSLTTSFGLDFLLFEDKKGGDVDTIQKAREWQKEITSTGESDIHISDSLRSSFDRSGQNNEAYNSTAYHSHKDYKETNRRDSSLRKKGEMNDEYRNKTANIKDKIDLDHIVSANEVHNDAGRILSGVKGESLANQDSNLISTHASINRSKSNLTMAEFIEKIPSRIENRKTKLTQNTETLALMPTKTPQQRDEKRKLEAKIDNDKNFIASLEEAYNNKDKMLELDANSRRVNTKVINKHYYTSSKFLKSTANASANAGMRMGLRQSVGLVLGEVWFELREQIPLIFKKCKDNFELNVFLSHVQETMNNIWKRVCERFKDILESFKDGALAGMLSSITTTIINIFFTTQKLVAKLIRETWNNLVQAAKLIFFNPEKLALGELTKEVSRLLGMGISVAIGSLLNQHLSGLIGAIPFGLEISAFVSALVTGILTVGMSYFLDYSPTMQKVWAFLDRFKSNYEIVLEHYQEINKELDSYLVELYKLEFNISAYELSCFIDNLAVTNSEYEKALALESETKRRNISLPFEATNTASIQSWLTNL